MNFTNLRGFFSPEALVQRLLSLPPLKTTVVDIFFARKVNHPFAKVGRDDLVEQGLPAPLIMRGAPSRSLGGGTLSLDEFEPYEVAAHKFFTAADLLNMQALDKNGVEARLAGVDDQLRRVCRATAEGIAATALTGTVNWPVALENGGFDHYQVNFGAPLSYTPEKLWDAADAKLRQVFNDLQEMETLIQNAGYGGSVKYWAGRNAYNALLALAETYGENPKAKLRVEVSDQGIDIGGYTVAKMAETYVHPETKTATAKVPTNKIMAWAEDAVHTLFYCALDDLDARLQALPYFSKPVDFKDPSGVKIVGRSKPFPAPVVKAICWATVTSA